jgi:hypothetical protein
MATILSTIGNNPTSLTDADATRMGLKRYLWVGGVSTAYNGGVVPSLSATNILNTTASKAVLIPYQMQDGTWRLKFHLRVALSASTTSISVTINGVTFSASDSFEEVCVFRQTADNTTAHLAGYIGGGNGTVTGITISTAVSGGAWFGDASLSSKPTWAY